MVKWVFEEHLHNATNLLYYPLPWQILGEIRAVTTAGEPGEILFFLWGKQRTISPISPRPNFTKFEHNTSIGVWDFQKFEVLVAGPVRRANMRHLAKFRARRSNICWDMAVFRFSKMAAVRQLRFLKVRNFNFRSGSDTQYASPWQISWRLVKLLRRYGPFSICSRWQPSAILDF